MATNRRLIGFDPENLPALELSSRDSGKDLQALAQEAFADLLSKHHWPRSLKTPLSKVPVANQQTRIVHRSGAPQHSGGT
jgi:hypothetical protein